MNENRKLDEPSAALVRRDGAEAPRRKDATAPAREKPESAGKKRKSTGKGQRPAADS